MLSMQDDIEEIKKMQRAMINGLSSMKADILKKLGDRIDGVEKSLSGQIKEHRKETKQGFIDINNRADLLGKQLNALDDDAPTGEDFNKLVKRVDNQSLLLRSKLEKYQNFTAA